MKQKEIHKLKGGIVIQPFMDEINRLVRQRREQGVEQEEATLERLMNFKIKPSVRDEEGDFSKEELKFEVIRNALANGSYGDEFDRALMYKKHRVFDRIQQVMAIIDRKRGTMPENEFYNLADWQYFVLLYKQILENIKTQYAQKQAVPEPERTEWYKVFDKKTNEGWFVNSKTNESAWELPPGGVEIPNLKPSLVSPAAEVTESAQIQVLPAAIKKQIRDFSQLFKEIRIGKVDSNGLVSILPKYMSNVNLAILNALGGMDVLNKLQQESRGYTELYLLIQLLQAGTTTFDDISRIIAKRFPNEFTKIRLSGETPTEKLIKFIELYETIIIQDFIDLLPREGSGQRCKKCGGTKKSGYVQRLIAEKKLLPQKVKKPSSYIKKMKMKFNPDLEDLAKRMEGMGVKKGKKQSLPEINEF
jgi:hypothetical protein